MLDREENLLKQGCNCDSPPWRVGESQPNKADNKIGKQVPAIEVVHK